MPDGRTIIFFNSNRAWGGGEKWHLEMAIEMSSRGHKVVVFADKHGELQKRCRENNIPVRYVSVGKLSFLNPFLINRYANKLKDFSPAVLILNLPADMKAGGLAARKAGVYDVYYRRGTALPVNPHFFNRLFFGKILKGVIANSVQTKNLINKQGHLIDENKISVIYNGVEKTVSKTEKANSSLCTLGNAGRLVYQKGQEYLIELAGELIKETQEFRIVIAGEGPLREKLQRDIHKKGVSGYVKLIGFQSDLSGFYDSLDVFVLPSRWEGFGYVMVEAMLHELPVVAFDVSSNPEIIEDNENGFLIPFEDIEAMKEKILQLINNPALRKSFGKKASAYAKKKFSIGQAASELEKTINPW